VCAARPEAEPPVAEATKIDSRHDEMAGSALRNQPFRHAGGAYPYAKQV